MSKHQTDQFDVAIIHALKVLGAATTRQIWSAIGASQPLAQVRGAVRRMTNAGIVRRVRRGLYRLS